MLDSPPTSDYDETYNGEYKSTVLEPRIKQLMKETSMDHREAINLVSRGQIQDQKYSYWKKLP